MDPQTNNSSPDSMLNASNISSTSNTSNASNTLDSSSSPTSSDASNIFNMSNVSDSISDSPTSPDPLVSSTPSASSTSPVSSSLPASSSPSISSTPISSVASDSSTSFDPSISSTSSASSTFRNPFSSSDLSNLSSQNNRNAFQDDPVINLNPPQSKKIVPKKSLIILVVAIFAVFIGIFTLFNKQQVTVKGTRNKDDLIKLLKLYQYGNMEEKKDINVNLPSNYAYASKILTENNSAKLRFEYANKIYDAYKIYLGNDAVINYILLYKYYMQLDTLIAEIRDVYIDKGEESAKNIVKERLAPIHDIKDDILKSHFETIEKCLYDYVEYYKYVSQAGCIKDKAVEDVCTASLESNRLDNPDFDYVFSEISALRSSIPERYDSVCNVLSNSLLSLYRESVLKKDVKKT